MTFRKQLLASAAISMGVVFVAVGTAIQFKVHHMIEIWAIQTLPPWLIDLSVSL